jgi:hypothetical protein
MVLKHKFAFNVKVTAKAGRFSICPDDLALVGRVFNMKAAGTVTCFAPLYLAGFCIFFSYVNSYTRMVGKLEIPGFCGMTILSRTAFRAEVLRSWN